MLKATTTGAVGKGKAVVVTNADLNGNVPRYLENNNVHETINPAGEVAQDELNNIIIKAQPQFGDNNANRIKNIRAAFNAADNCDLYDSDAQEYARRKESIMIKSGLALFKHRRLKPTEIRIVQENRVPELVTADQGLLRRSKRLREFGNPSYTSSTIGIHDINKAGIYGYQDRYIVIVPPGQYVKVMMGQQPQLLDEGTHVIKNPSFNYDKKYNSIKKISPIIKHKNITIVRVPQGQVACYQYNDKFQFLQAREQPYVFNSNFSCITKQTEDQQNPFYACDTKQINNGPLKRFALKQNELIMVNNKVYSSKENENGELAPIIINNPNAMPQIISTALNNVEFPSAETIAHNKREHKEHPELDTYYTSDTIPVGVKIFVAYRIDNPERLISTLDLSDVLKHIELVVQGDVGRILADTKAQDLLASDMSTIPEIQQTESGVPSAPIFHRNWQDAVKTHTKKDLAKNGIELTRLNIMETTILQQEIASAMAKPATQNAEARANASVVQMQGEISRQQAEQNNAITAMQTEQTNSITVSVAQANSKAMLIEAESRLQAAKIERQIQIMQAETKQQANQMRATVYQQSPELYQLALMDIMAKAMNGSHFSSAVPMSDMAALIQNMCQLSSNAMPSAALDKHAPRLSEMTNVAVLATQLSKLDNTGANTLDDNAEKTKRVIPTT